MPKMPPPKRLSITTPLSAELISTLHVGDMLYLSGLVVTARDLGHKRILEYGAQKKPLPRDINGGAVFHVGPIVKKDGQGWVLIAAGPTTSARMEQYTDSVLAKFHPRLLIGKGGMGPKTQTALQHHKAVYASFTGGAALIAAKTLEIEDVDWLDLGIPEAFWILRAREFGPLIVTMDSHGANLHDLVTQEATRRRSKILGA